MIFRGELKIFRKIIICFVFLFYIFCIELFYFIVLYDKYMAFYIKLLAFRKINDMMIL